MSALRVAMLAPISWRVPPRHYAPWEQFVSHESTCGSDIFLISMDIEMARPRRQTDETALFVRIPTTEAAKLDRAANALGAPKRELITRLVARYVDPEDPATLSRLGGAESELSVGRAWFRPAEELEILTPAQLAGLLQVEEATVVAMAERRELPARKVGEEWRFSREAILAWLAEEE